MDDDYILHLDYEMEVKDQKNGKPQLTGISRSTQTKMNNNDKDSSVDSTTINESNNKDTTLVVKQQLNNNEKIGNGPLNQSELAL